MTAPALVAVLLAAAAAPERITFEEAVKRALTLSPTMRSAEADVVRARALVEQAASNSLPTLSLNGAYTRLEGDRFSGGALVAPANSLAANALLQVPIIAPNRWAIWRRAAAAGDATKAEADDARRQVALNTGRIWLSVLAEQRVVQAQQRGVDTAQAHLKYATDRRTGGLGTKLDELRAAQEFAVARTQLASALAQLERLQEELGVAIGTDLPLDAVDTEPDLKNLPDEKQAMDGARTVRLDVVAAKVRVDSADVATRWDFSDYTPWLSAIVEPGYQNPATATVPQWNFTAQVLLTIPIYDGGLRYGQERERRALLTQAQVQLEAAVRQAGSDVRTGLVQVQRADEALVAAQEAARDADSALTLAQEAFRAGGTTNLEVIDAERAARDAATNAALAENSSRQARLEALAASGQFP